MAKVRVNFRSVRRFKDDLNKFARETTRKDKLQRALEPVGAVLLAEAQKRVPVKTGGLYRSLTVVPDTRTGPRGGVSAGLTLGHVGPEVRLSHLIEFGTRHSAAQPYLRPAAQAIARKGPAILAAEMRKILSAASRNTRSLKFK